MLYSPVGTDGRSYMPSLLVTLVSVRPVRRFRIFTFTSGITAFVGSVTVPLISPEFAFCAHVLCVPATTITSANILRLRTSNVTAGASKTRRSILGVASAVRIRLK